MVPGLQSGQRYALLSLSNGRVFVQLDGLRHIIDAKDRNLWRVYLLHFSGEKVLSHHARRNKTCTRAARPARAARPDHLRRPGVIGVLFPANKYDVSHFEVSELGGLATLAVLGLLAQFHGNRGSVRPRDVDRKSTRLNSSHVRISYAVFCLKKKKKRV